MMTDGDLTPPPPGGLSEKIFRRHRERLAIVYIVSRRFSRSNVIRNRPSCSTLWLIAPFISAGRGRVLWWSMTILVARVLRSKVGSAFSA